jgi:hypothetical protein
MPPGLGQSLQTRRDVHSVAKDIPALGNDIAEVNTDAELNPLLRRRGYVTLGNPALDLNRASHGIDHTLELCQETVAGVLHNPPVVLDDLRMDQLLEVPSKPPACSLLIRRHQARISRYVGGQYRGKAADGGHCQALVEA